jgi:hypothetical protein
MDTSILPSCVLVSFPTYSHVQTFPPPCTAFYHPNPAAGPLIACALHGTQLHLSVTFAALYVLQPLKAHSPLLFTLWEINQMEQVCSYLEWQLDVDPGNISSGTRFSIPAFVPHPNGYRNRSRPSKVALTHLRTENI